MKLGKNISTISALKENLLIRRAKNGDRDAYGKLYQKYLDQIYRYIFYRVSQQKQVAEDITQDVFIKAWEKLDGFETKKGTFKAWLYQIARNKTIDHLRQNNKKTTLNTKIIDNNENIEEKTIIKEEYQYLLSAINKLSDEQKEIIIMLYINDLSYKEAAKVLDKNEEALRALKYRALKKIKKITNHEHK